MQMDCRTIPNICSARMGDPSVPRALVLGRERRPRARVPATGQEGLLQARIVAGNLACVLACIARCLGVVARVWDSRTCSYCFSQYLEHASPALAIYAEVTVATMKSLSSLPFIVN